MENEKDIIQVISNFGNKLLTNSVDLDPEINDLLDEHFFDLL